MADVHFNHSATGQAYEQTVTPSSSHASAEWIREPPSAAAQGRLFRIGCPLNWLRVPAPIGRADDETTPIARAGRM